MTFVTHTMTLKRNGMVLAENLDVQLDTVSIDLILSANGAVATDSYDLYSWMWTEPVPERADYFIDQATGTAYSVFGNAAVYDDHLEVRVTKYLGVVP